ncbi:MAG: DNA alkylation repair protein [Lachnospiraceae bacterium]
MNIEKINERLFENAAHAQDAYYKKVVPGAKPSIGVRVPVLRKMAKEIAKEDYRFFMEHYTCEYLEQETLKAFVIGYAKDDIETILRYADDFIPQIHDWMVNDAFCQNFSIARKYRTKVFDWLMKYKQMDEEYPQRVVAVLLMSHFLVDDYYQNVLDTMNELKHDGYYTKMGVAWCVATAYAKYPQDTMKFLKKNELEDWTYNKSIQKMIESYRVSAEDKEILRTMKRMFQNNASHL